jgi:hypothetical protein
MLFAWLTTDFPWQKQKNVRPKSVASNVEPIYNANIPIRRQNTSETLVKRTGHWFTRTMEWKSCPMYNVIVTMKWDYASMKLGPVTGPLSILQIIYEWLWICGGMILTGWNRRTRRKTSSSAILSNANHKWTDAGANPGLGERSATNRLSHGTV